MQECTVNKKLSLRASPAKSLHCLRNIMRQSEELCMHLVLIWALSSAEMVLPGYTVAPRCWVNSIVRSLEIVLRLVTSKFSG